MALIRSGHARTIGEIAFSMDMARSTVMQRVDLLISQGLVVAGTSTAETMGVRGRPAAVLQFDPGSGVVLVAQLGMTGARVAVTDMDGSILAERFAAFAIELGPETVTEKISTALTDVLGDTGHLGSAVEGIGVGLPSAVELATSRAPMVTEITSWEGFPMAERLSGCFDVPVFVENDVNLLALGEQRICWPDSSVLLCVKAGSVIGCGTLVQGAIVAGAQGVAGGIGHLAVPGDTTPCACGNVGCLDAVASGRALTAALKAAGLPVSSARDVATLARNGVPEAAQAVRKAGTAIGAVLAYAVNLLNPDVIAVWGYLAEAEDHLLAGIRESVYRRALPAATRSLRLVKARLEDGAGLTGAAMMVTSNVLSPSAVDLRLTKQSPASTDRGHPSGA